MSLGFPATGDRIGRFRVVSQLGAGGMGVVYSAVEETLDRKVALKVIAPMFADDAGFRHRFSREAKALASLDSPHVVQVYAHGEEDGYLYIATQLIPDGDLGQMVAKWGAAPVGKAVELVEQVASGLKDAHAAGLVHRDIKPGNVLVRRRGSNVEAYLGDFGIARRVDAEATRVGTAVIGTPSYMAPELHGGATAGPATDIYALGCVLWVTLTGQPPYRGRTEYEIVAGHVRGAVPQLQGTSPLVEATNRILRRSLAKDPEQRYPSAQAMRDELREAARLIHDPAFMQAAVAVPPPPGSVGSAPAAGPADRPSPPAGAPSRAASTPSGPVPETVKVPAGRPPSDPSPASPPSGVAVPFAASPAAPPSGPSTAPPATWASPSPSRGRSRRTVWVAVGAAATVAVVGGVTAGLLSSGGGDPQPDPGPSVDAAFAELPAEDIVREAEKEMKVLDTVRLAGMVTSDDGQDYDLDMRISSRGDCSGTMKVGEGSAELLRVDGETWFKPDRGFWEAVSPGQEEAVDLIVSLQGDNWVVVPPEDASDFDGFCDLDELLEDDGTSADSSATLRNEGQDELDGQPVVKVVAEESDGDVTSYVSLAEPHYILRLDAGDQGSFDLSEFDEPLEAEAPAAGDVVDFDELQ